MTDEQEKLAEEWAKALEEGTADELEAKAMGQEKPEQEEASSDSDAKTEEEKLAEEWANSLAAEEAEKVKKEQEQKTLKAQSETVQFKDLTEEVKQSSDSSPVKRDLEFILDIPLTVSAQLGSTQLLINELLQLGQGSVIELNKLAGEPLEILVNGKLVARGEAVVINEKFGVRLTDIISPIERIKQLG